MAAPVRVSAFALTPESIREWIEIDAIECYAVLKRITEVGWLLVPRADLSWANDVFPTYAKGKSRECLKLILTSQNVVDRQSDDGRWSQVPECEDFGSLLEHARYLSATEGIVIENGRSPDDLEPIIDCAVGVKSLDVYDQYLLQSMSQNVKLPHLLDSARRNALRWIVRDLKLAGGDSLITFRLIQSRNSRYPLSNQLMKRLADYMRTLSSEYGVRCTFEIRGEKPVLRDDGRGSWLHGRFLVLDGRWVVSSDRSLDWFAAGKTVDNLVIRWAASAFPASRLSSRWAQLPEPVVTSQINEDIELSQSPVTPAQPSPSPHASSQ